MYAGPAEGVCEDVIATALLAASMIVPQLSPAELEKVSAETPRLNERGYFWLRRQITRLKMLPQCRARLGHAVFGRHRCPRCLTNKEPQPRGIWIDAGGG
jgi:hypothetical protein